MADGAVGGAERAASQYVEVLVVGAGIAGVGSAYHLKTQAPNRSFKVLEAQESFGGTWRTHRYPGVRSDSDLYTFGYRFKPWRGVPIASGEEILAYMAEVIEENDLDQYIQYNTKILSARWSSPDGLWYVEAERRDTGQVEHYTTRFLWMCQGYYRHSEGYTPAWPGMDRFKGPIVHPQTWPQDLDCKDKRIVVIGSGATAATLIPSLATEAGHVTMLQRSPTYFSAGRNRSDLAESLRELEIDESWIHEIVRRRTLRDSAAFTRRALEQPELVRAEILDAVRSQLPVGFDVEKHFTPSYLPWRQRVAFIPNGDMFKAICDGKASVATDEIATFTETGIELKSGEHLEADIIVTATGFNLNVMGDIQFVVDNEPLDFSEVVTYRGMMFTGVPNLVWVFGYFRASWTLRADLVGDFVPRLLNHMDKHGYRRVAPALRPEDDDMPLGPWVDPESFNPGYLARGMHMMPKSGVKREWRHTQDYWSEKDEFPDIALDDPIFQYA